MPRREETGAGRSWPKVATTNPTNLGRLRLFVSIRLIRGFSRQRKGLGFCERLQKFADGFLPSPRDFPGPACAGAKSAETQWRLEYRLSDWS